MNRAQRAAVVLAALGLACGGPARAPEPSPPPPARVTVVEPSTPTNYWVPGETLTWNVSFRGVPVVRAQIAVGQPGVRDGRRTLIIKSLAQSIGVGATFASAAVQMQSWLDLELGKPTRFHFRSQIGDRESIGSADIAPGVVKSRRKRAGAATQKKTTRLPGEVHPYDAHTVLGFLRGWQPAAGDRADIVHFDDERLRPHRLRGGGRARIGSVFGMIDVIRIDGRISRGVKGADAAKSKPYTVFISDDDRRLPLRIEMPTERGDLVLELVAYDAPAS